VNSTTNTSAADQNKSWYVSDSPLHLKLRHIFPPRISTLPSYPRPD
jgi:hypothetical protein